MFAVGFLDAVLAFVLLNLALLLFMRARHPADPIIKVTEQLDSMRLQQAYPGWREDDVKALIRETPRKDNEFEYEPLTGFRERAFRGRFVNIDPAGFRLSKGQVPWPPKSGQVTVFVFGGSTTFGWYLPDDQTIPSYLQAWAAQNGSHIAVYNFARPAYFSSQELALFQQLLREGYVPQVAVFVDGLNDFILAEGEPKFTAELRQLMSGQVEASPFAKLPMVRAAQWVNDRWMTRAAAARPRLSVDYSNPSVLHGSVQRWLANKKMIESIAAAYGVKALFVWQPVPMYKYDLRYHFFVHSDKGFGAFVRVKYGYQLMEDAWAEGKLGGNVLWLADVQQDRRENLYVDSVHYTADFSREIAAQIGERLPQQSKNAAVEAKLTRH